jgi:hypothetical protein
MEAPPPISSSIIGSDMREGGGGQKQLLVEILLPRAGDKGPVRAICKELTERFGGARASSIHRPGVFWYTEGSGERDSIAVLEVMTETFDLAF